MEHSVNDNKKDIVKLAHVYFQSGHWDKALAEYKKILLLDPNDMNTHKTLGDIYFKKNSIQLAYDSYSQATSGFLSTDQADKALQVYKKIVRLDTSKLSDSAQTQINYAHGYIKIDDALTDGKIETAIELFGKILKFRPDDPMVHALLVVLNGKISQLPVSIQTYQTLGDAFFKNNMLEKAQAMFRKIMDLDPQNLAVRLHSIQVYLKQGSHSEAKKEYLNLAEEAFANGNFDQAFDFSKKAIELKSVEARYISGLIYFKRNNFEAAVTEFEILLRFKVNHLSALIYLGKSFDTLGRLEKARAAFHKALEMDNDNPDVQEAWIEFCIRTKDVETALPNLTVVLDKAIKNKNSGLIVKFSKLRLRLEPDNVFTHTKLVEALQALGDLKGTTDAYFNLAITHEKKKQYHEAVKCLEKALMLSPANNHSLEKVLAAMRKKELGSHSGPSFEVDKELPVILESSDFWAESHPVEPDTTEVFIKPENPFIPAPFETPVFHPVAAKSAEIPIESHVPIPPEPPSQATSLSTFETPLALASMIVQQGYFKAAIEIYQQILETNPGLEDVRRKLAEVSTLYLSKLTGSK